MVSQLVAGGGTNRSFSALHQQKLRKANRAAGVLGTRNRTAPLNLDSGDGPRGEVDDVPMEGTENGEEHEPIQRRDTLTGYAERPSWRSFIYKTFDDPTFSTPAKVISLSIMFLITVSTLTFILETEYTDPELKPLWDVVETIAVSCFTIEYLAKLFTCPNVFKFVTAPMNLVDLAAILPFWFTLFNIMSTGGVGFIRAVRLIRVFRIVKFGRYSNGIRIFMGAIKGSLQSLGILAFMVMIAMIIFSSLMYYAEGGVEDHPTGGFDTIPQAFWWCLVTMTTVGYGDVYPHTKPGKCIATMCMLSGVLILALPITVVGSNFAKMVEMFEEDSHIYQIADSDKSGGVDEMELREFLLLKKKEGTLRKDIDVRAPVLLERYAKKKKGMLNSREFADLQADVLSDGLTHKDIEEEEDMDIQLDRFTQNTETFSRMVQGRLSQLELQVQDVLKRMDPSTNFSNSTLVAAATLPPLATHTLPPVTGTLPQRYLPT